MKRANTQRRRATRLVVIAMAMAPFVLLAVALTELAKALLTTSLI